MKRFSLVGARVVAGVLVFACGGVAPFRAMGLGPLGQGPLGQAAGPLGQAAAAAPQTVDERSKALAALFDEIWQERLKHSPEFASFLGDKRYNDQWSDYSVKEVNASLERGRVFLERLSAIDTTGLKPQEILSTRPDGARSDGRAGGSAIQGVGDAGEPVQRLSHGHGAAGQQPAPSTR